MEPSLRTTIPIHHTRRIPRILLIIRADNWRRSARYNCRVRSVAVHRGTARSCLSADWGGVLPHRYGRRPTLCRLTPKKALAGDADEALRARFLDLVTDENLREKVAAETAGVRDVILALAFGALAREREDSVSS